MIMVMMRRHLLDHRGILTLAQHDSSPAASHNQASITGQLSFQQDATYLGTESKAPPLTRPDPAITQQTIFIPSQTLNFTQPAHRSSPSLSPFPLYKYEIHLPRIQAPSRKQNHGSESVEFIILLNHSSFRSSSFQSSSFQSHSRWNFRLVWLSAARAWKGRAWMMRAESSSGREERDGGG